MRHFDLIVIGSGPAGEKGAAQAAYFGKRVAIIEREKHVGGVVVNTGGLASKTLRETVLYYTGIRQRGLYDHDYSLRENMNIGSFMHRKQNVVRCQWDIVSQNLLRHNIEVIHGTARLKNKNTVIVGSAPDYEEDLHADVILIATGSSPLRPGNIPFTPNVIYDSDEILKMSRIPRSMLVLGGGAIGTEYSSIFTAMGVEVTLLEPHDRILGFLDAEIVKRLTMRLEQLGLRFLFNDPVINMETQDGNVQITLQSGATHTFETALIAVGRRSNIENLGLEEVGVALGERGLVKVNEKYQTNVPNIYAAGDVIGFPALASTSMEQARVAMVHAFDLLYKETVSRTLPVAVYAIPEISAVGLTEEDCKNKKIAYEVGRAYYENSPRGQIIGDTVGMIKLIFSPGKNACLAHISSVSRRLS
ncbi:MAG: FAD-dependent oxidoreductase [Ginsengibacter sp.]